MDSHLRLPLRITLEKYKRWHVCVREFKKIGSFPVPFPPLSAPSFSLFPLVPSSPLPMVNPRNYHRTLHLWKYPQIDVLLSFSFSFSLFFFYYRTKNPFDWNVLFAGTFEMKSRTATFLLSRLFFKVARPVDIDYHSRIESLTGNNRRMELTSSLLPFLFFNSLFLSFSLFLFNPLSIPIMRKRSFKTHQEWIRDCRY